MDDTPTKEPETTSPQDIETLENDFQQVLNELMGDKSLERFRLEYEKLHTALKKSHGQEKKLVKKCRELNSEIVNNAAKVQTALKLSQEDQSTIGSLKKEIEKAWKMVDASHEKGLESKEHITQLKEEILNLTALVQKGAGLSVGQEQVMKELVRSKEDIQRTNEEYADTIKISQERLAQLHLHLGEMDIQATSLKKEAQDLRENLASRKAESEREGRRKERFEKEIVDLKNKIEAKSLEENAIHVDLHRATSQISNLEKQLSESKSQKDQYLRDYQTLYTKSQKLTEVVSEQHDRNVGLELERQTLVDEIKSQHELISRIQVEKNMAERRIDKELRANQMFSQKLEDERKAKELLRTEIKSMQSELDLDRKQEEMQRAEIELVKRDRNLQLKNVHQSDLKTKNTADALSLSERVSKSLEAELRSFRIEAAKQRKLIYQLEKERERAGEDLTEQRKACGKLNEELRLRDMRLVDAAKKLSESDIKLKNQQQLYEAVRSDRNLYSKNLIETQDEIAEMKRKFKIMHHQIEQLKEEIGTKDRVLVKEHFEAQKVEKQRDQTKVELNRLRQLLTSNEATITNQDTEVRKLTTLVRRMDDEMLEQKKEYDQVINERDILGTQLIRRNDELALLYEKLKIQHSTLRKGEAQYQDRVQDVRILKLKIGDLKREHHLAKAQVTQVESMKHEFFHLQRELLQEKTKVKALSEELENPMNVHRWRKLEGSDPATYEMIQKIQTLQKRLIQKTEEVVEKDLFIVEKEKLYVELKNILARQPGPEVAEQLSVYQQNVKDKTYKMKAMASEMNMAQAKMNDYKFEIERLTRELHGMKRQYYQKKLKDKMMRAKQESNDLNNNSTRRTLEHHPQQQMVEYNNNPYNPSSSSSSSNAVPILPVVHGNVNRFLGGGFNLNQ